MTQIAQPKALAPITAWRSTLLVNLPLPLIIGLLCWLGVYIGTRSFGLYNSRMVMLCGFSIILAVSLQLINGFSGQFSLGHAGFMAVGAYFAAYPAINIANTYHDPAGSLWFYIVLGLLVGVVGGVLALIVPTIRSTRRIHRQMPLLILFALIVWLLIDFSAAAKYTSPPARFVWTNSIAFIVHAFDWLLAHGQPMAAKISQVLPGAIREPLCFLILVLGGGASAAVVGLIVGVPALRLRGDYLAIATLGLAEIIRVLIRTSAPLGGALGLTSIPRYTNFAWLYTFVLITIVVVWRIAYSPKGRAIVAVRDDEIAAGAMGVDTTHHKVLAFVVGSFFAGVAGALFAMYESIITPDSFTLTRSIEAVAMVTLGGLGSISGAILAAVVLTLLPYLPGLVQSMIPNAVPANVMESINGVLQDYRMIIYSLLLIIMMLARPQGLLGGRELWPRRWR